MSAEPEARKLLERATDLRSRCDGEPVLIVDASEIEAVAADAIELAALRALLAGLPDDDWQPFDWAVLSVAQTEARTALAAEVSP